MEIKMIDNNRIVKYLDHGIVRLVDTMPHATPEEPGDWAVVQAARVSYGKGTKTSRDDEGLIRYLMRHRHTSPFEMIELKFHIKIPIFVMRQLVRHRTASLNEYSGRYSEMTDEFYVPALDRIQTQSQINKQGSGDTLTGDEIVRAMRIFSTVPNEMFHAYQILLGNVSDKNCDIQNPQGVSKELARIVLPLSNYTELYWKQNLHNFLHMVKLRADSHAQKEIQELANAMYSLVKPLFPVCCQAWEDYVQNSVTLTHKELEYLKNQWSGSEQTVSLSKRELDELNSKIQN
jgi:thymidylate synthase (FAD)